jgi:hypothetical protein
MGKKPDEYLEDALQEKQGSSQEILADNKVKAGVKAYFVSRSCCTMIRPAAEESVLQSLNQKQLSELRPEFQ